MAAHVGGAEALGEGWSVIPGLIDTFPGLSDQSFAGKAPQTFERHAEGISPRDGFRVEFLRKLCDEKVWVPKEQRPPKHKSVIIFDWDDTLLCTSSLSQARGPASRHLMVRLEGAARKLLEMSLGLGHTFIITNAQEGWVEESASLYMPSLLPILKKFTVISARSAHEAECGGDVSQWKKRAFLELGRRLPPTPVTNLVSVGDSNFELEAARLLGEQFAGSLIKTVKLQERPSAEELVKELELLTTKFQVIVEKAANLKIHFAKKSVPPA